MSLNEASIELTEEDLAQFDWLSLHKEMNQDLPQETKTEKLIRKCKENPLVPIGAAATTAALGYGLWSFRQGRVQMSQYMMRTRVGAQFFTVVAIVGGYMYSANNRK
ncbi:HIG1 domain family member 2A, mitochondrial [Euwallacea fornicatus]|uniref:HIG1 domain family member 2A, mitochondrial n=1 Tax=Euwallacea fornicatus TaxID=995702 RepID=UPI00338EA796